MSTNLINFFDSFNKVSFLKAETGSQYTATELAIDETIVVTLDREVLTDVLSIIIFPNL